MILIMEFAGNLRANQITPTLFCSRGKRDVDLGREEHDGGK